MLSASTENVRDEPPLIDHRIQSMVPGFPPMEYHSLLIVWMTESSNWAQRRCILLRIPKRFMRFKRLNQESSMWVWVTCSHQLSLYVEESHNQKCFSTTQNSETIKTEHLVDASQRDLDDPLLESGMAESLSGARKRKLHAQMTAGLTSDASSEEFSDVSDEDERLV